MLPETQYSRPTARRVERSRGRVGLCLVAGLSVIAGMTDAIGFMATGDFVSFMSGNTTRLAVASGAGNYTLVAHIALLVIAFIAGNALGVIAARVVGRRAWPLLIIIGALLCVCGVIAEGVAAFLLAVIAMGMINAVVEEVNGLPIGLTYVTGALSRFGRGLGRWLMGERRHGWRVQLVPWCGMLAGAIIGALLGQNLGLGAMLVSGIATLSLGLISSRIPHSWQLRYMPK
jgi:uncharacterized membrane protein YoaK (UPF0700 family)